MIDYSIRIEAPAEIVFGMLTEADLLTEWMARDATSTAARAASSPWSTRTAT
jgi:uncharacterized protein YndB with AHSA1/START domain